MRFITTAGFFNTRSFLRLASWPTVFGISGNLLLRDCQKTRELDLVSAGLQPVRKLQNPAIYFLNLFRSWIWTGTHSDVQAWRIYCTWGNQRNHKETMAGKKCGTFGIHRLLIRGFSCVIEVEMIFLDLVGISWRRNGQMVVEVRSPSETRGNLSMLKDPEWIVETRRDIDA